MLRAHKRSWSPLLAWRAMGRSQPRCAAWHAALGVSTWEVGPRSLEVVITVGLDSNRSQKLLCDTVHVAGHSQKSSTAGGLYAWQSGPGQFPKLSSLCAGGPRF